MINDYQLVLSDAQAITNASADSTYYIDTLAAGNAITPGATFNVKINTACTTADGGTIIATLSTGTSSDLSTGEVVLITAPTLTVVSAAAGSAAGVTPIIKTAISDGGGEHDSKNGYYANLKISVHLHLLCFVQAGRSLPRPEPLCYLPSIVISLSRLM